MKSQKCQSVHLLVLMQVLECAGLVRTVFEKVPLGVKNVTNRPQILVNRNSKIGLNRRGNYGDYPNKN